MKQLCLEREDGPRPATFGGVYKTFSYFLKSSSITENYISTYLTACAPDDYL